MAKAKKSPVKKAPAAKKKAAPKEPTPKKAAPKKAAPKKKRVRRTNAQRALDKAAEQRKAQLALKKKAPAMPSGKTDNKAKAIAEISDMVRAGALKPEVIREITERYNITDVHGIYNAAMEYIRNNVFQDNIEYYAHYIAELDYLYRMAKGTGEQRPEDAKDYIVDYKEARNILAQKEAAHLAVNQLLQVY